MSNKLQPSDAELFRRVEEVVHYIWDPIGICEHPSARDEYHSYLTGIYSNVQAEDLAGLIEYMKWVTENMGLSFNKEHAIKAAQLMLDWKKHLDDQST